MTTTSTNQDPMEFLKTFWGNMGFPLPGIVTPTLDTDELSRRINDLKSVEGWLKANLSMLQMTIQGLEMQRATLTALQSMGQAAADAESNAAGMANPFANPALWPWNFMAPGGETPAPAEAAAAPEGGEPAPASAPEGKPKR